MSFFLGFAGIFDEVEVSGMLYYVYNEIRTKEAKKLRHRVDTDVFLKKFQLFRDN